MQIELIDGQHKTWIDHYNITTTTSYYHYEPSIAIDKDDTLHIAWYGRDNATYYNNIHYINRSAEGIWGQLVMVTKNLYQSPYIYVYRPSIAVDGSGNAHIVWYGYTRTISRYNILYAVHWAGNDTWSNWYPLTQETSYYQYYPTLIADDNDNVHVIWEGTDAQRPSSYNIFYLMYNSTTSGWGSREYLTDARTQYYPTIGYNNKGEVDVLWYGYSLPGLTSPYVIHHSQKSATGWVDDYNFYSSGASNYYPNLL